MKRNLLAAILLSCFAANASNEDDVLRLAQEKVDESLNADARLFLHAAREPSKSVSASRRLINDWIRFNLKEAIDDAKANHLDEAVMSLCMARHTLRDAVSQSFNDEHGDPIVLLPGQEIRHQKFAKHKWADQADADLNYMFEHGIVPDGDLISRYGIDTAAGPIDRANQAPPLKRN